MIINWEIPLKRINKEILDRVTEFLDKPFKEKDSIKVKSNRNRPCWIAAKREVFALAKKYENIKVKVNKEEALVITKITAEENKSQENTEEIKDLTEQIDALNINPEEEIKQNIDRLYNEEYGFTEIIDILIDAKLPIIGHNMIYDVMFMYRQFIDDLPETYDAFVKKWRENFPKTYDTKLISSYCKPIPKTWLGSAYECCLENETLKGTLNFEYAPNFEKYNEEGQEHEAAYDAYMTGVIFATVAKYKEIIHVLGERLNLSEEYQLMKNSL